VPDVLDWAIRLGGARGCRLASRNLASVALTATIYNFEIDLADADRGVYESFALTVARHPSESEEYLLTRTLAYALEYADGIQFSRGISDPEEPTISIRDLTGGIRTWIEIGNPEAARLHKASKASPRVVVYTHKDPVQLVGRLSKERIHRSDAVELWSVDRDLLAKLARRLERRMAFSLSVTDRELYLSIGSDTLTGKVTRLSL
jgi:uncharacterized protein YaeQ